MNEPQQNGGWSGTLQWCLRLVVACLCAIGLNMALANQPSADDAFRGLFSHLVAALGGGITGQVLGLFGKQKEC